VFRIPDPYHETLGPRRGLLASKIIVLAATGALRPQAVRACYAYNLPLGAKAAGLPAHNHIEAVDKRLRPTRKPD
jgi:hypothetical protein